MESPSDKNVRAFLVIGQQDERRKSEDEGGTRTHKEGATELRLVLVIRSPLQAKLVYKGKEPMLAVLEGFGEQLGEVLERLRTACRGKKRLYPR